MFVSLTNIRPLRLRSTDWKSALRNEFVLQDNEYARNSHFKMKGYKCTKARFEKKSKSWPVEYLHNTAEELNLGLLRTNPDSVRV